jgi:uncharacterized damage-inducible protein DinB
VVQDVVMTSWIAPPARRADAPPFAGAERDLLEGWLEWHRQTLLTKCAGLTAEQLKLRSAEPSTLTLLGLLRHMSNVERSWFRGPAIGGERLEPLYCTADNEDGDFDDVPQADAQADYAVYLAEVEAARAAMTGVSLDHEFATSRRPAITIRGVHLHMIEEYARHNGHADLLRERIDGATGD